MPDFLGPLLNPMNEDEVIPSNSAYSVNYLDSSDGRATNGTNLPDDNAAWNDYNGESTRVSQFVGPSLENISADLPDMDWGSFPVGLLNQLSLDSFTDQNPLDMMDLGSVNEPYGNDASYSYTDANMGEIQDSLIPSPSPFDDIPTPISSTNPSHESTLSQSRRFTSNDTGVDTPNEPDYDDFVVCYGMLPKVEIKLGGDMTNINEGFGANASDFQRFTLTTSQEHVFLNFPDDEKKFGYLRVGEAKTILQIISGTRGVEFEPKAEKAGLRDVIERASKPAEAMVKVDVNVYGPRHEASQVGRILSEGKLWLQRSPHRRDGSVYENPHFLRIKIQDDETQPSQTIQQVAGNAPGKKRSKEEQRQQNLRKMVEEVYKSVDKTRDLKMVEGGRGVIQQLLKHQQEALGFMLERESGHINDKFRLWREVVLKDGRTEYWHKITKDRRRDKPEESGGGILADEMGMGKSLSILALIMKTMDNAKDWARDNNSTYKKKRPARFSHSTLVVVSAALLIKNWKNEIEKHLERGLTVIKYHGNRKKHQELERIVEADIVVTTYHTLAVEYEVSKAHIIRRPSTSFFHACDSLVAKSRWCLTGTPIQNKLSDIGTLFRFIQAQPLDQPSVFRKWIEAPFDQTTEDHELVKDRLVLLLGALCLRRTKEVLELPSSRQYIRYLDLSPQEREQYERTRNILIRTITHRAGETEKSSKFGLFQMNLQLRILCNHGTFQKEFSWHRRSLMDEREAIVDALGTQGQISCAGCQLPAPVLGSNWARYEGQCAHVLCAECIEDSTTDGTGTSQRRCPICVKWHQSLVRSTSNSTHDRDGVDTPEITRKIEDNHEHYFNSEGHSTKMNALIEDVSRNLWTTKSIIFSCWTRTLYLVSKHLDKAKIPYLQVDGDCPVSQRQKRLNEFEENDEMPVLIMTTGTGAFGLNLTCANRIFIVELQWNPSVENQAIGRATRLGQKHKVQVIRYIFRDTVEKDMRRQQQYKQEIAALGFDEVPEMIDMGIQPS
ncbi:hypothetical protein ACJ41O_006019 [Fusarium nematophilum]